MKAIAKKVNNEWIAEVRTLDNEDCEFFDKRYPIVSPSDIKYLEENGMDGKDIDGNIDGGLFWFPATPPIHSDPAGANKFKGGSSGFDLVDEFNEDVDNLFKSAPQTGRTYTEGEVEVMLAKFFRWWWNTKGSNTDQAAKDWLRYYNINKETPKA